VTLRDSELDALATLAAERRQPEATAAAELVRAGLLDRGATLAAVVRRRTASAPDSRDRRGESAAGWLPPERRAAAIAALRDRYPHELRYLRGDALLDPATAEQAAALSFLREQIDDGRYDDPRIELLFGHELRVFSNWLQTNTRRHR